MAQFSNPELPEEVNNSDERPVRSFFALTATAVLLALIVATAVAFLGGTFARYLPYETEVALVARYAERYPPRKHPVENYLQDLADRLIAGKEATPAMVLPKGMKIRMHYVDEPVVNAFATLGGNVVIYRGLIERMPDENTLAMVIAHEIAHAQHRHPIASLGRGVAFGAAITLFSAGAGASVVDSTLSRAGMLTLLTFSRAQEEESDDTALSALNQFYGHAGGALETFKVLSEASTQAGRAEPPKVLSTHPITAERIARLEALIVKSRWRRDGERGTIPATVREAVAADAKAKKDSPGEASK